MTTTASSDALSRQHTQFHGRLVFVGFGSIGQGVLPLILRHIGGLTPERMTIITADEAGRAAHHAGRYLDRSGLIRIAPFIARSRAAQSPDRPWCDSWVTGDP